MRFRPGWKTLTALGICLLGYVYFVLFSSRIVFVNLDDNALAAKFPGDEVRKEAYFSGNFVQPSKIENLLDNSTFVHWRSWSKDSVDTPTYEGHVDYYGPDHTLVTWFSFRNDGKGANLKRGSWGFQTKLAIINYRQKYSFKLVGEFCKATEDNPEGLDACLLVDEIALSGEDEQKIAKRLATSVSSNSVERERGDVFDLQKASAPPFAMKLDKPVTFATLFESKRQSQTLK